MKITDHVYFYPNKKVKGFLTPSNTVIIVGVTKQVMIDPGINIQKRLDCLIDEMKEDNLDIRDTAEIWLTHVHPDHFQMMYDLFKIFKEERAVRCHPQGKSILSARNLKENFISREKRQAGSYWKLLWAPEDRGGIGQNTVVSTIVMIKEGISDLWRKINNINLFFNGEVVSIPPIEVKIIALPGHAPDEIGFWIAQERLLISGDLISIYQPQDNKIDSKIVLYNFHSDIDQALESIEKMKQIKELEILLTPHSDPVEGKENLRKIFDKLISKIRKYMAFSREFINKYPNLSGFRLVKELAKALPEKDLLLIEKRFIALAVLKSLGKI